MKLAHRLLLSSLAVIVALTVTVAVILDRQLHRRVGQESIAELSREAQLIATQWTPGTSPMLLAHTAGAVLGHRVTLIRRDGVVVGDSQFDSLGVAHLQNHSTRPEVIAALRGDIGSSRRTSPSEGDNEVYVAVPAALGIARVSESTTAVDASFDSALRDVVVAGIAAALVALALAALFARSVSRPVVELRDAARAIAGGDLSRKPAISAPGEIGDLANALYRMSEQLAARLVALQDDEALLAAVIESLDEGVLAISARQDVLRINAAGRSLLNVREPAPFSVDYLPRDRTLREALTNALQGHSTDAHELDVGGRTLSLTAQPLADGGAVLALSDLTRTRRLESVRRDFVANVSHELRTPLTIIGGFAETLAEPDVDDKHRRHFASLIATNAHRMQRIVDELLDLSRIESGGWIPRPTNVDVAAVAADALASVADTASEHDTTVEAHIAPDARWVYADRTALRQVLGNLVENAVRHTSHGSVIVFAHQDAGGTTWVGVRDSGCGIAPAHLPRIFERFYRADASRSREHGGTGLGLAIVKHLVEAHGGAVRAESTLGRGTTISASFPAALRDANDA